MEWIYAAPLELGGGRYLRLILQAKRARYNDRAGGYWYYQHLDHGSPPGSQAQTLIGHAASVPGTLPLYVFYHATSATAPATGRLPAIEGVNLVFADLVAPVVSAKCQRKDKKVSRWRASFMPLSTILCWPVTVTPPQLPAPSDITRLVIGGAETPFPLLNYGFHPDVVARRLNERRDQNVDRKADSPMFVMPVDSERREQDVDAKADGPTLAVPVDQIPDNIQRAINGEMTAEDRRALTRPRVIFTTRLTRNDPDYPIIEKLSR
ncbi:hypothetical protein FHG71_21340 [Rubellimicrobium roseum]|uniref:Uncharacterized protein n=2 Tax=Rubellimicrobium roseum TaxID=687525 RepID=A0A5C4N8I4_9RHOB|nr:DUF6615 family protein [Rubellimicrobium roseum]TNC61331.1 hypothetical protein FHG71_21340 [Rubellimicrobium roseum]